MEFDLLHAIQAIRTPWLDQLVYWYTTAGDYGACWIILIVALLLTQKHRMMGFAMGLALVIEILVVTVTIKPIVSRLRPCHWESITNALEACPTDYSFPSGHSASSFAVAMALFCLNKKWGTVALVVAFFMALSRLYVFMHFPTDVLAGSLIGAAIGYFTVKTLKKHEFFD